MFSPTSTGPILIGTVILAVVGLFIVPYSAAIILALGIGAAVFVGLWGKRGSRHQSREQPPKGDRGGGATEQTPDPGHGSPEPPRSA